MYKRLGSDLEIHMDWKGGDGKGYVNVTEEIWVTRQNIRQNRLQKNVLKEKKDAI